MFCDHISARWTDVYLGQHIWNLHKIDHYHVQYECVDLNQLLWGLYKYAQNLRGFATPSHQRSHSHTLRIETVFAENELGLVNIEWICLCDQAL